MEAWIKDLRTGVVAGGPVTAREKDWKKMLLGIEERIAWWWHEEAHGIKPAVSRGQVGQGLEGHSKKFEPDTMGFVSSVESHQRI